PNPFNPSTLIRFDLPSDSRVVLTVYDITGREIIRLVDADMKAGIHYVSFNGDIYSSGVYFYKITAGQFINVRRMVLLK
ncbi:MAG: T9SS type A sorting domain-containing protein, partial [Ignavibacteria bacterium]|nr:T9SS type A sorting domain-containing protein [Ignavibacteria bacterium]